MPPKSTPAPNTTSTSTGPHWQGATGAKAAAGQGAAGGGGGGHWQGAGGARGGSNKFLDHHSFDDETGDVYCFCNTQPRIKASRLMTRKESSPNLGRYFWKCGNWTDGGDCKFFLWCDEAANYGRRYRTPSPPGAAFASTSAAPPTSPQKRPRPSTPPPKPASRPLGATPSSAVTENFDDIDFDSLGAGIEDEIEDDYEEEPPTQYSSAGGGGPSTPTSSPSKKQRFTSFGGGGGEAGPSTPTRSSAPSRSGNSAFAAIRDDPDSPFHALQRSLFGGESSSGGVGSTPAPPSSSPMKPSTSSDSDSFAALSTALFALPGLLDSAKKDRERDGRLLAAGKKKEEALRRQVEKAKEDKVRVEGENERLKERVRMLEEEVNELRTRAR
ncbi:hypothetical protein JCM8097_001042 [Rhodosporidiobolus ruineniae]